MRIVDVEQYSPEYWAAKLGKPSASNFDKLLTLKMERSKERKGYMHQLAGELVLGVAEETYQNGPMRRGLEMEPEAAEYYEFVTNREVRKVGFCLEDGGRWGCSPDRLVGEDGGLEIKCPSIKVHVGYLLGGALPSEFFQQIHGQIAVTGRRWVDFLSYYPGLPALLVRIEPDAPFIKLLNAELEQFCDELEGIAKQIRGKA